MTDNEIVENQRTLGHIRDMEHNSEVFVLDLTKYCLFWRHYVVTQFGEVYDELFGFENFYSQRHRHSLDCNIFSNSRLRPPAYRDGNIPIPGPDYMNRFSGGYEGLNQKQWTHITECACQLAMEMTGVEGRIMGQGDNQVILVNYKARDDKATLRDLMIRNLYVVLAGIGHRLKREETWNSRYLHEYGKARAFKGSLISTVTKKIVSFMQDHDDFFSSMSSGMSSLNTMTEGFARVDHDGDIPFILNQASQSNYLAGKPPVCSETK
jgi:Paramyxovirus RNA dependent RNA polymerase.